MRDTKFVWAALLTLAACSGGGAAVSSSAGGTGSQLSGSTPTATPTPKPPTPAPTKSGTPPTPTPSPTSSPTQAPIGQYIKHVVIVVQENRSFDNMFAGFPGADTAQSGLMSNGKTEPLQPVGLEAQTDIDHSHSNWVKQYAGGKMYFDLGSPGNPTLPYAYVPQAETQPLWSLAEQYGLADRMFQSNTGPSFAAHQYLIAATSQVGSLYADDNPYYANFTPIPITGSWGCDAPSGAFLTMLNPNGGPDLVGPFPCINNTTVADELAAKGVSWREYAPAIGSAGGSWSAFDAIKHIRYGPGWKSVVSPETTVLTDAPAGNVASVTWVIPTGKNSDHSGNGSTTGPQWVASVVNAFGTSPQWNSTAIFILWDDWGGWYDHVVPPQLDAMGLSFRVPLIVVSPYARHGYVSHVQHEEGSILRFIEDDFGLARLAASDSRADNLQDFFDFSQQPARFHAIAVKRSPASFFHAPELSAPDNE